MWQCIADLENRMQKCGVGGLLVSMNSGMVMVSPPQTHQNKSLTSSIPKCTPLLYAVMQCINQHHTSKTLHAMSKLLLHSRDYCDLLSVWLLMTTNDTNQNKFRVLFQVYLINYFTSPLGSWDFALTFFHSLTSAGFKWSKQSKKGDVVLMTWSCPSWNVVHQTDHVWDYCNYQ